MGFIKTIYSITGLLIITGCSSTPYSFQSRPAYNQNISSFELAHSSVIDQVDITLQHLNVEKDILYTQSFGGGGVGAGVLLGPLGVAANSAMINSKTKSDAEALYNKIKISPKDVFIDTAKKENIEFALEKNTGKAQITPYLYVSKTKGEKLLLASALIIEQSDQGKKWTGKYMYQLAFTSTINELASLDHIATERLVSDIAEGYTKILSKISAESSMQPALETKITFKSDFLSPRFDFDMLGSIIEKDADIVWVRTFNGIFAVRNNNIIYKVTKT